MPFATDTNLDLIGEIFGVPRLTQSTASVDIGDNNFEWYVRSGTFGDINSGQDIVIPSGIYIYTAAGINGPIYVAVAVTCPAAASSQPFSATSLYSGSAGNAPADIFCTSNFTNYTESAYGSLLVTDNYGIVGGSDPETDANYRYRIQLKIQSPNRSNEAALRFQCLLIPGIQNVVFDSAAGTFTCYAYGVTLTVSALLQSVQHVTHGLPERPDLLGTSSLRLLTHLRWRLRGTQLEH